MKILHIIPGLGNGGAEKCLLDLVTNTKDEIEHIVLTCSDDIFYKNDLQKHNIKVLQINLKPRLRNIANFFKVFCLIKKVKPDVIHCWLYLGNLFGLLFAPTKKYKLIWTYHQAHVSYQSNSLKTYITILLCKYFSHQPNITHVFVSSLSFKEHHRIGFDVTNYKIIPNGIDIDAFKPSPKIGKYQKLSDRNQFTRTEFIVGCVSRYDPIKNIPLLLESFSIFVKEHKNSRLKLIGSKMTPDNRHLCELVSKFQIVSCVELCGPTRHVADSLRDLDLHVLTSFHEGFGNVTAEALACGVPSAATMTGAAEDLLSDNGWLITNNDPETLSAIMAVANKEYIEQPEAWMNRRKRARQKILSEFTLSKNARKFVDLWMRCVDHY